MITVPTSRSSTSCEDDMTESEVDIVSVDRSDDPTEEKSHVDNTEEHKTTPPHNSEKHST